VPAELNTVLYPVKDLDKARPRSARCSVLEPHVDSKYTSAMKSTATSRTYPERSRPRHDRPEPFYDVEDIASSLAALRACARWCCKSHRRREWIARREGPDTRAMS